MATNTEIAQELYKQFVDGARLGRVLLTYGDMAAAIGRAGQHRLLDAPLDALRELCVEKGLPDIATVVVSKDSLTDGMLKPSRKAIDKHGGWPGLRKEQATVMTVDWTKVEC